MNVLNATAASMLDKVIIDATSPANINYVKARMAIEAAQLPRAQRRACKMEVISYLKGEISLRYPDPATGRKAPNQVVFSDGSQARF